MCLQRTRWQFVCHPLILSQAVPSLSLQWTNKQGTVKATVAEMSACELLSNKLKYLIREALTGGLNSRSLGVFLWL